MHRDREDRNERNREKGHVNSVYVLVFVLFLLIGVPLVIVFSVKEGKKIRALPDETGISSETVSAGEAENPSGEPVSGTDSESVSEDTLPADYAEETIPETENDETARLDVLNHYANLGVVIAAQYLNIRETPSTDGLIIGRIWKNSGVNILEDNGSGWYFIESGGIQGYVKAELLATGEEAKKLAVENCHQMAKVNAECLNVRNEPSMEGEVWTTLNVNEMQSVNRIVGDWIEVIINNSVGYISADYVQLGYYLNEAVKYSSLDDTTETRRNLVNYAMNFLGTPYVYGGLDPYAGIDCSGFTQYVFAQYGVELHRESYNQKTQGTYVDALSAAKPGDLLFYTDSQGTVNHVAIYMGSGQIIHACESRGGVVITSYNYAMEPTYIKNVLGDR